MKFWYWGPIYNNLSQLANVECLFSFNKLLHPSMRVCCHWLAEQKHQLIGSYVTSFESAKSRVGNSLFGFSCESLVFWQKRANHSFSLFKRANHSFGTEWITFFALFRKANCSFKKKWQEQIPFHCSFYKERQEPNSKEQKSEFPILQKCTL